MAYNNNKGPQHSGDIQYENDPDDTQIDFEENNIKLKAGGVNAFDINETRLSGGVGMPLSASSFWGKFYGDGSGITGVSTAPAGADQQIQFNNAGSLDASTSLTWTDTELRVTGSITASVGITGSTIYVPNADGTAGGTTINGTHLSSSLNISGNAIYASASISSSLGITGSTLYITGNFHGGVGTTIDLTHVSSSLNVSGNAFYGDGTTLSGIITNIRNAAEDEVLTFSGLFHGPMGTAVEGSGLIWNGADLTGSTYVTSYEFRTRGDSEERRAADGTFINHTHVSSALNISGAAFYGDGSNLTGLPSAAITTYTTPANNRIVISTGATSVKGEDDLTYDGSILSATGQISASLGVSGSSLETEDTVINAIHISSSLNISGSKFYGDGSNLTGLSSAAISSYTNGAGTAGKIITSVDASSVNAEADLTFDGSDLKVIDARISGSSTMHVVGNATFGSDIATTGSVMVSGSSGVSASFGLSSGQGLTTSYGRLEIDTDGSENPRIKANSNHLVIRNNQADKHVRVRLGDDDGDAKFQIRNNSDVTVARVTSQGNYSGSLGITGSTVYVSGANDGTTINFTHVSSSLNISGAAFYGDGSSLTGVTGTISAVANGADNRVATFSSDTALNGEANLTFDGTVLNAPGITSSVGILVTGSAPHLQVGAPSGAPSLIMLNVTPKDTDNKVLMLAQSREASGNRTIFAVTGSGKVLIGGNNTDAILNVSGSDAETLISAKADTVGAAFTLNSAGDGIFAGQLTASLGVTGSSLETATTVINPIHVSSSLNISGAAFYGDGSNLTGIGGGGTMSTFIVSGNAGAQQTISDGNTLFISGGTGITSVGVATDQLNISLDDTDVSADSYTYTALTVDAQGRITAASSGTPPALTNVTNQTADRVITSDGTGQANAEENLTFDGSKLSVTGQISASLGLSGSTLYVSGGSNNTVGTTINQTHISSSLNISGSKFYGDGSNLTGIATGISDVVSDTTPQLGGNLDVNGNDIVSVSNGHIELDPDGSGKVIFRGNATKGSGQFVLNCENNSHGITVKGPPHSAGANYTLTLPNNDGDADQVLKTDGAGNTSWVDQGGGISFNGSTANGLVTYGGASTADVESNLTFDGTVLNTLGITSSVGVHITGSAPQLSIGNANQNPNTVMLNISPKDTDNKVLMLAQSREASGNRTLFAVTGSGKVLIGGNNIDGVLNVSGSDAETLISAKADTVGNAFTLNSAGDGTFAGNVSASLGVSGSTLYVSGGSNNTVGTTINQTHVSSSLNISGAAFYGDGSNLTGIGGGGISFNGSTANGLVTYGGATTGDVESNLTFDGSLLSVTGDISGSSTLQAVGATTLGNNLSVSGNINVGGQNLANAQLYVQAPSDNSTLAFFKSPSNETIFAVTGSGKVVVGGAHFDGVLNVSGSDNDILISAKSDTHNPAFYVSGSGEVLAKTYFSSSHLKLESDEPTLMLSSSNVAYQDASISVNSAGNILIQNNTSNKHIVLKTSDAGTIKEGLRLDGAVPEVVVNQQAESLVNFRVESDTKTHMLYVTGSGFVGIDNADPKTALDVHHDPTSLQNDTGGGEVVKFGGGTTVQGKTYYLHSNGDWDQVSTAVALSGGLGMLAIALGTNPAVDGMLIRGFFDAHTYLNGSFTTGATLYITGSGGLTTTRPSTSGESLRVAGTCTTTANVIYFNPSPDYLIIS